MLLAKVFEGLYKFCQLNFNNTISAFDYPRILRMVSTVKMFQNQPNIADL